MSTVNNDLFLLACEQSYDFFDKIPAYVHVLKTTVRFV